MKTPSVFVGIGTIFSLFVLILPAILSLQTIFLFCEILSFIFFIASIVLMFLYKKIEALLYNRIFNTLFICGLVALLSFSYWNKQ